MSRFSPDIAIVVERAIREYCRKSPGFPDLSISGMASDIVDALRASLQPATPTAGEPIAWVYDLATRIEYSADGDRYDGFDRRVSLDRPTVPERSIKNLQPLYAAATGSDAVAGEAKDAKIAELEAKILMLDGTRALEGIGIDTHATMVALCKTLTAKQIAAEKRVAELEALRSPDAAGDTTLRDLAQQLLDAAHYSTDISRLEDHCRDVAQKLEALAEERSDAAATAPKPMAAEMLALAEKLDYARHSRIVHGVRVDLDYPEMDLARDALRYFADAAKTLKEPREPGSPFTASEKASLYAAQALPKWRHLKRGSIVTEIARGFAQVAHHSIEEMTCVVIYRHDEDGRYWVRNAVEFDDGRFEAYLLPPTEDKS